MENQRQKEILTNLEGVNDKKSSQQLPSCVMATGDSLFCKMCSPLFCFEQEKALKNFSKKLYTNTIKKREEAQTKNSVWNLKNALKLAQILEPSSGTRQVCVSVYFLFWSLYKTNRFHVAVGLFSNRSQRTSKCGKNIVTHSPAARVPLLCFYHILTSSVIYYWTDARQHGIYLLSILHAGFVLCLSFLFLNMCKMCFRNLHLSKILFFCFASKAQICL